MITDYYCRGVLAKVLTSTPLSDTLASLAVNVNSQLPAGSAERLDFLGTIGAMREWVGQRQAAQPIEYSYSLKNKKWENTVQLPLDWIKNDKTGNVQMAFAQLGNRLGQWKTKLIADLVQNGAAGGAYVGFDGLAFFSASHAYGVNQSVAVNNIVSYATSGGPTLITPYEAAKGIAKAWQAMLAFLDDRGEPINEDVTGLTIVVPLAVGSQMGASFQQAISQDKLDTGSGTLDNPVNGLRSALANGVKLILTPRLTGNNVAVFNSSDNAVPFIFQENLGERLVTALGAGSDFEHKNDAWEYGMKAVGNAGYGRFTDAVQIQFT